MKSTSIIGIIIPLVIIGMMFVPTNAVELDPGDGGGGSGNTGYIRVTLTVPDFAIKGSTVKIYINTYTTADAILLYIDGQKVKTWYSKTSVSYSFTTSNSIRKHSIHVTAYNSRYEDHKTKVLRLQFPLPNNSEARTWLSRAKDYARSFSAWDSISHRGLVWDVAYQALKYGRRFNIAQNALTDSSDAVYAMLKFAEGVLCDHYKGSGGTVDQLTAYEMAYYFRTFNGDASNAVDFIVPGRGKDFDCADMASMLSGMATALNIPSRMISLTDEDEGSAINQGPIITKSYNHMFTEIYNPSYSENGGWFLIDPGHVSNMTFTYNTPNSVIVADYSQGDNEVDYLRFIWGMDYGEWGSTGDPTTAWYGMPDADNMLKYEPNPWSISVTCG